ncbi:MAG: GntR family transcriptional regulator [Pseudomonadota bacterium]
MSMVERSSETRVPAHEQVYRTLRTRIMQGEVSPGAALTLRGIAEHFGVSMTPAREAVRRLVAEGALKLSTSGRVTTPELTNDRIEELAALRALLEPELGARALPRAHAVLIDRMEDLNLRIRGVIRTGAATEYIRANHEFHRMLYLRAQAPAMLALVETVWLQLGPTMQSLYAHLQRPSASLNHSKIISALRAGDEASLRLALREDVTAGLRLLSR